jgi:WD40 repeat protein
VPDQTHAAERDWLGSQSGGAVAVALWCGPDGNVRLASAGTDGTIRIWDPAVGAAIGQPLIGHTGPVWGLTSWVGADGRVGLASAGDDGTVRLWDPDRCVPLGVPMTGHVGWVRALTSWAAPAGEIRLASGGNDKTIRIWRVDTGAPAGPPLTDHQGWLRALTTFTTAGGDARLVSASDDATIRVWDPGSGTPAGPPLLGHSAGVRALASLTDPHHRTWLASASNDSSVRLWDPESGQPAGEPLVGHAAGVTALTAWTDRTGCTRLATASDDSAVQLWNADFGAPAGSPLTGHAAGVLALSTWTGADGGALLASAGNDGTIRVWDTESGAGHGAPLTGHSAGVLALACWVGPDGANYLASAGYDENIRLWRPDSGRPVAAPLTGHTGTIWALAAWADSEGRPWLASGGDDGTVRIWDLGDANPSGAPAPVSEPFARDVGIVWALHAWRDSDGVVRLAAATEDGTIWVWRPGTSSLPARPFRAHAGGVLALTTWRGGDGRVRLTSAGGDAIIRTWEPDTGEPLGPELSGHRGGVRTLASWVRPEGDSWLASGGSDGTIRLWDPATGRAVRTIEVGPVAMWGLSDQPADEDLLGRQFLAQGIAEQLYRPGGAGLPGPAVVAVEGSWGSGKSTLLDLVRTILQTIPGSGSAQPGKRKRKLTVHHAARQLRRFERQRQPQPSAVAASAGVVTAWFNPWAHQSGEQLWAGLAHEIIEAASDVLYPTSADREHYWFDRNLSRVDRVALLGVLRRRLVSPVLGVVLVAVVAPLAIAIAELGHPLDVLHRTITPATVALTLAAAALVAGAVHSGFRYLVGAASNYLPGELFYGPVAEGLASGAGGAAAESIPDPLRRARAGSLYLYQHDVGEVVADLAAAGYELIVFVDDLDRCSSATLVETFEAVNLFLPGFTARRAMHARFVIGFDPAVVAAHLDRVYVSLTDPDVALHGEDPSPGWAFLRKLVQLPVLVPAVTEAGVDRFLDTATGLPGQPGASPVAVPPAASPGAVAAPPAGSPPSPVAAHQPAGRPRPSAASPQAPSAAPPLAARTVPWRTMEQHPQVRALLRQRLAAQPERAIREAKRLLNVWQLYERVLAEALPEDEHEAMIQRAQRLIILAEIVARWPALQRSLHSRVAGRRGLQLLATHVDDDEGWQRTVECLGIAGTPHKPAVGALRQLLREYDGRQVADLADIVL